MQNGEAWMQILPLSTVLKIAQGNIPAECREQRVGVKVIVLTISRSWKTLRESEGQREDQQGPWYGTQAKPKRQSNIIRNLDQGLHIWGTKYSAKRSRIM